MSEFYGDDSFEKCEEYQKNVKANDISDEYQYLFEIYIRHHQPSALPR